MQPKSKPIASTTDKITKHVLAKYHQHPCTTKQAKDQKPGQYSVHVNVMVVMPLSLELLLLVLFVPFWLFVLVCSVVLKSTESSSLISPIEFFSTLINILL